MACLAILGDLSQTVNAWRIIYHTRKMVESFKILLNAYDNFDCPHIK